MPTTKRNLNAIKNIESTPDQYPDQYPEGLTSNFRARSPIYLVIFLMPLALLLGGFDLYLISCIVLMTLILGILIYQVYAGQVMDSQD